MIQLLYALLHPIAHRWAEARPHRFVCRWCGEIVQTVEHRPNRFNRPMGVDPDRAAWETQRQRMRRNLTEEAVRDAMEPRPERSEAYCPDWAEPQQTPPRVPR